MNDCQDVQEQLLFGDAQRAREHSARCADCRSFQALSERLEPPAALIDATMARLRPALQARARARRALRVRLGLAGAFSLPVIAATNALWIWVVYTALTAVLPPEAALTATTMVAASLLLAVALAYGSLPLLAEWGLHLKERTA